MTGPLKFCVCLLSLACASHVHSQSAIQNPLVRPAWVNGAGGAQAPGQAPASQAAARSAEPAGQPAPPPADDLRDRASARLTQEDFNIRQQALNAANVPAPLVALFSDMVVSAHASGAVVLRRPVSLVDVSPVAAVPAATNTNGNNSTSAPVARQATASLGVQSAGQGPSVLRLKVGRAVNINGYLLRAKVEDFDVTVDWQNEMGRWVTVFFGAVESGSAVNQVPFELEKVDTKAFDYLVPATSSRVLNNGIAGGVGGSNGVGAGGFGSNSGFGGGFGSQPGQQPGFGSSGSAFR